MLGGGDLQLGGVVVVEVHGPVAGELTGSDRGDPDSGKPGDQIREFSPSLLIRHGAQDDDLRRPRLRFQTRRSCLLDRVHPQLLESSFGLRGLRAQGVQQRVDVVDVPEPASVQRLRELRRDPDERDAQILRPLARRQFHGQPGESAADGLVGADHVQRADVLEVDHHVGVAEVLAERDERRVGGTGNPLERGQLLGVDRPGHLVVADLDERRRQLHRGIQVESDLDVGQPQRIHGRQRVPGLLSPRRQVPQRMVDVIHPQRVLHGAQRELHVAGSALRHRDALTRLAVTALLHPPHTEEHQQTGGRESPETAGGAHVENLVDPIGVSRIVRRLLGRRRLLRRLLPGRCVVHSAGGGGGAGDRTDSAPTELVDVGLRPRAFIDVRGRARVRSRLRGAGPGRYLLNATRLYGRRDRDGGLHGDRHVDDPPGVDQVGVGEVAPIRLHIVLRGVEDLRVSVAVAELLLGDRPQGVTGYDGHFLLDGGGLHRGLRRARGAAGRIRGQGEDPAGVEPVLGREGPAVRLLDPIVEVRDLFPPLPRAEGLLRDAPQRVTVLHRVSRRRRRLGSDGRIRVGFDGRGGGDRRGHGRQGGGRLGGGCAAGRGDDGRDAGEHDDHRGD